MTCNWKRGGAKVPRAQFAREGGGFGLDVDVDSGFERVWGSGVRDNSRRTKA